MRFLQTAMLAGLTLAAAAATPAIADPASGYTTSSVNQRGGPGTQYPVLRTLPGGAQITIYGCLSGPSWCDVDWYGRRGWVSASYVQGNYAYYPPQSGGYVQFGYDDDYDGYDGGGGHRRHHRHDYPGNRDGVTNYGPSERMPGGPDGGSSGVTGGGGDSHLGTGNGSYCTDHPNSPSCGVVPQ